AGFRRAAQQGGGEGADARARRHRRGGRRDRGLGDGCREAGDGQHRLSRRRLPHHRLRMGCMGDAAQATADKKRKSKGDDGEDGHRPRRRAYERKLPKLHVELVKLKEWVKYKGLKICIVFEGRDGAGKGGVIKAITERVSPRVFRVIALPAPTERE